MNERLFELAEHTSRNIFLTGKAGTGKTTFLNGFVKKTRKKFIVVAPTGIAAINAGGVTIHSMFGLPTRTFIPTLERIDGNLGNNIADLHQHFKYRKEKRKLLREVEIIIIDEVSMLRADVLDMMDYSLKHIRRNPLPFGGVQMLFIGDLYQLPPVVRDEHILQKYYRSPFFFSAKALEQQKLITVELQKVYRQNEGEFLDILNAIREGNTEEIDFELLNSRYDPDFEAEEEAYVYLTSHNRMAEEINRKKLADLPGEVHLFKAKISGDFKENQFPNDETLELKAGAQIMFIRNDASAEKRYFNGKLAEVIEIDDGDVLVQIEGDEDTYKLKKEIWEQKKYSLDEEKNIKEEVQGSFEQFPVRLSWAVTIHKSQGLTFDRVVIDAGRSFASGQVYVALSRCRTLEGIVLKSRITPEIIFQDKRILGFQDETDASDQVEAILAAEKYDYAVGKVVRKLDFLWMEKAIEEWFSVARGSRNLDKEKAKKIHTSLQAELQNLQQIYSKFERILRQKVRVFLQGNENWQETENKCAGAVNFFFVQINEKIFRPLSEFYAETKGMKGLKTYNEEFRTLIDDLQDYLNDLKTLHLLEKPLFNPENEADVNVRIEKIPSHVLTYQQFEEGLSIHEISKNRGIMPQTVYGHLAKFADRGILDLSRLFSDEKISAFSKVFAANQFSSLNEWKKNLPADYEFHEIRILLNHHQYLKEKEETDAK